MGTTTEVFRLNYTKTSGFYCLSIVGDISGKVAGSKSANRPKVAQVNAWLVSKGFEAYGDMLRLSDGSYVSMVRKTS